MLLSNSIRARPKASASYQEIAWDDVQTWFRTVFFSGEEYPDSRTGAERLSPIAAAHRIYTGAMSVLPYSLYQKNGDARLPQSDQALDYLLKVRANERMSPALCKKIIASNAFWHGTGYGWIVRDGLGRITDLIPLDASTCRIRWDGEARHYWYDFTVDELSITLAPSQLVIVFFDSYDGVHGRGVLDLARETIKADGSAQMYGRKFYQNGARMSGIVEVDADLGKDGRERIKKEFTRYAAGAEDAFKVAVLTRGYKYTPMGLSQKDSQYIESRSFSVEEVSRFTGIPAYMLQTGKQSYQSNEQQQLDFVENTLLPHVTAWEQEMSYKLIGGRRQEQGWYLRANVGVLLRGDNESRSRFYEKMIQNSVYCPDDCRAFEEKDPIPGGLGQKFLATKNLASLEAVVNGTAGEPVKP